MPNNADKSQFSLPPSMVEQSSLLSLSRPSLKRPARQESVVVNLNSCAHEKTRMVVPANSIKMSLDVGKRIASSPSDEKENGKGSQHSRLNLYQTVNTPVLDYGTIIENSSSLDVFVAGGWDKIDRKLNSLTSKRGNIYAAEFFGADESDTLLQSGKNAVMGFQTEFLRWNKWDMRFEAIGSVASSFSNTLLQLSHCGSWIRRLTKLVEDIRGAAQNAHSPLSLLSIASIIEQEVTSQQCNLNDQAGKSSHLIELVGLTEIARGQVYTLAALIGCENLNRSGRLTRIPSAVELLERAFERASLMDSPLLWRVASAAMEPWVEQLNFVVGLRDKITRRSLSIEMKEQRFPESFIEIDEDTSRVFLENRNIPSFFPLSVAQAACDCYRLLCIAGTASNDVGILWALSDTAIPSIGFQKNADMKTPVDKIRPLSLTQPNNFSIKPQSIRGYLGNLGWHKARTMRTDEDSVPNQSMQTMLMASFGLILHRRIELNLSVKKLFMAKIEPVLLVILDLYLLNNGRFWSLLIELIPRLPSAENMLAFTSIQELVYTEFSVEKERLLVVLDESELGFSIEYKPTDLIRHIFDPSGLIWIKLKRVFAKLLTLHYSDPDELKIYSEKIQKSSCEIRHACNSDRAGLFELASTINAIDE